MSFFDQYDVKSFDNLELIARQVVEGFIIGLHKSPFHGFSVEFAEHRLYNQGESTRNIDWKVYARTDKMFTKRFEEETNLRCQIVLDVSSSMYFPDLNADDAGPLNKIKWATLAAAALMQLLKKQRDAFGLSIFDSTVKLHTPAKSSTSHYKLLLTYLENSIKDAIEQKTTEAAQALHQIADSIHKRSLVVIFSDMFDRVEDPEHLFSALQHLKHNKHEVLLFHVVDKSKELDFDFENRPYMFIDVESGERVKVQPHDVKDLYRKRLQAFKEELNLKCLQYKIDFVEADINQGFKPILESYLIKRSRMN
ncbi:MAG: DUF58 domain-containing protein [Saprospiraceae bacterium]|jgi:uncharacterized protein (DUF58 family)|nr:DUF58 domain-containing protein [Saprospiraceae bacterium]